MITYDGKIITGLTGKWVIPNHAFDISYSTVPNGSVSGPSTAYGGDTVTVTSTPGSGYLLDYITVNGVAIQGNTFTMPYGNVTVGAQFKINYNPLNLPPYTIRVGQVEAVSSSSHTFALTDKGTARYVGEDRIGNTVMSIWDVTYNSNNWSNFFDTETKVAGNTLIKVYGANSTGVTNMSYMFRGKGATYDRYTRYYCLFDTSSVTNMEGMFYNNRFHSLSDIIVYDTHNVTNASYMYFGTDISGQDDDYNWPMMDLSKVTNAAYMFANGGGMDTNRITFPLFDLSKVVNAEAMFAQREKITVPKFNLSSLQNMRLMFHQCKYLIQNSTFDVPNLVDCYYTYSYCNYATINAYAQYQKMAAVPTVTDHSYTFLQCNGNGSIPNSWGGSGG